MEDLIRKALWENGEFTLLSKDDQDHVVEVVVDTAIERIKSCTAHNAVMTLYDKEE